METKPVGRASIACLQCRRRKVRCTGKQPCARCIRLDQVCSFSTPSISTTSTSNNNNNINNKQLGSSSKSMVSSNPKSNTNSNPRSRRAQSAFHTRQATPDLASPKDQTDSTTFARPARHPEHLNPPFSTFTYTGQPTEERIVTDIFVPPCAQPFPILLDPIECGIVGMDFARWLFKYFQTQPGNHAPFVQSSFEETRQRSPYLLSAILAIAYVNTPVSALTTTAQPSSDPLTDWRTADLLANLAHNHLAFSILRRPVILEDVIATLLLAMWNIKRSVSAGPSSWPLIGHAQRMCRRVGFHEAAPLSDAWAVSMELDNYDHFYILGYGRPLTSDRPPPHDADRHLLRLGSDAPRIAGTIARSELVQPIRHLMRWIRRVDESSPPSHDLQVLLNGLNDDLDAWSFRWTSTASEFSPLLGRDKALTLLFAHHVRLSLNMLPLQTASVKVDNATNTKAHRLAFAAAVAIIDIFAANIDYAQESELMKSAPLLAGSILAHAALCLLPTPFSARGGPDTFPTLGSGSSATPMTHKYFGTAMQILKSDANNQGYFTKRFASTIDSELEKGLDDPTASQVDDHPSGRLTGNDPLTSAYPLLQTDPTELMTWLSGDANPWTDTSLAVL